MSIKQWPAIRSSNPLPNGRGNTISLSVTHWDCLLLKTFLLQSWVYRYILKHHTPSRKPFNDVYVIKEDVLSK